MPDQPEQLYGFTPEKTQLRLEAGLLPQEKLTSIACHQPV